MSNRNFPSYLLLLCTSLFARTATCNDAENVTTEKSVFYIMTLLPYASPYNPSWHAGDDIQPVLEMAADQINQRDDILSNYSFELIHFQDGCDENLVAVTLSDFVKGTFSREGKVIAGVIGPGCSSSTISLSPLVGRPEVNLVNVHDAGSPTLANRMEYSHLLGVLGSSSSFVKAFLYLIGQGNWSRIALLFDDSRQYFKNTKRLLQDVTGSDIELKYVSPVSETHMPLEDIQQRMLRVIFIFAPVSLARKIMCRAFNLSMTFDRYQYILMSARYEDFSSPVSFIYDRKMYDCTIENIRDHILNGSFLLFYNLLPKVDVELLSNLTYAEYITEYEAYREQYTLQTGKKSTQSYWATNLYDAVWAWALVLDRITKESGHFEAKFGDSDTSDHIIKHFYQLQFEGMSGSIEFDNQTGFVKREVVISQAVGNSSSFIIFIGPKGDERCNGTKPCGTPTRIINDTFLRGSIRESSELATFFLVVNVLEFIAVVFLHILTVVKRKMPSVKATSIKLLNISYIGVYILILGTFLWTFFSSASLNIKIKHYFCQILWAWTIPIGFSLSFGPVVMKTWRLYRIFEHYLDPGPFISTPYLIAGTLITMSLYLTVSVSWTAFDHYVLNVTEYFEENEEFSEGVNRVIISHYCICKYRIYWLVLLGLLSLVLLSVGTILALLTRKIYNSSFATSSLRVLVYLMAIVIVLGSGLYSISEVVERNNHGFYFRFSTLNTLLNAVICLFIACIFIPPLIPLARKTKARFRKISSNL